MTSEEFNKVCPTKTIISVKTKESDKKMLVKFLLCNSEEYDGYWMCCTEDLTNPYPTEIRKDDWDVYANNAEIISY